MIFCLGISFLTADEYLLSEDEKTALNQLATSQIPQVSYSPISKISKEYEKKIETSGVAIHSADKSARVEVKVKKKTDKNGKEDSTGSVSVSRSFNW